MSWDSVVRWGWRWRWRVHGLAAIVMLAALTGCAAGAGPAAGEAAVGQAGSRALSSAVTRPSAQSGRTPAWTPEPTAPEPAPGALLIAPPSAGALPQTSVYPHTASTAFSNAVHDIWLAVVTGDAGDARPAFFPEGAYRQVKAIADPDTDWQGRLWYDFTLDLAAVHRLVKPGAALGGGWRLLQPCRLLARPRIKSGVPGGRSHVLVRYSVFHFVAR
jgi:hypothetical protein